MSAGNEDLGEIVKEVKRVTDEVKSLGEDVLKKSEKGQEVTAELKTRTDELLTKQSEVLKAHEAITARLNEMEQKMVRSGADDSEHVKSIGEQVASSDQIKSFVTAGARGSVRIQVKDITSLDASAGPLIQPQRVLTPFMLPQRRLTIRDLLGQANMTSNMVEYVKEAGFTNAAAVVTEGGTKPESDITFEDATAPVRTIAHWVHISRQAMDDAPQIRGIIDGRLRYGLDYVEEAEILTGDGTGQHLDGLISNATAYDAAFTPSLPTGIDTLRLAMLQASLALFPANGIVTHPINWAYIATTKTTDGAYLFANPQSMEGPSLWGLPVLATPAMTIDKFLVGAFNVAATIWDRMGTEVLISSEDRSNFITNMLTVRAEKRLALTVQRPEALIYGDFGVIT